jgi:hypothetical protein
VHVILATPPPPRHPPSPPLSPYTLPGIVTDKSARPHLYTTAEEAGGDAPPSAGATAYDMLWELKGKAVYRQWMDGRDVEAERARIEAERRRQGWETYAPGKRWWYNGAPLKKQRFNEDLDEWEELDEPEDEIECSKTLPWGEVHIFPRNHTYGYRWFRDGFDERPGANRSMWEAPGREVDPNDIQHLPLLRQRKILDFSQGRDPEEGLSVVDLAFQEELVAAVEAAKGTDKEAEAVARFNYYMFGISEDMQIPPLDQVPELIHERRIADPIFADRTCGHRHMMTLILADPRLRDKLQQLGVPVLDPETTVSRPPSRRDDPEEEEAEEAEEEAEEEEEAGVEAVLACGERCNISACPLMLLRQAIDAGVVSPLTRSLQDAELAGEDSDEQDDSGGVWVQGRKVVGVEGEEMDKFKQQLAEHRAAAAAAGMVEEGEEEGARGFSTDHVGFETELTLWYLRRLHYSMYLHNLTAPPGMWCGGREELQVCGRQGCCCFGRGVSPHLCCEIGLRQPACV